MRGRWLASLICTLVCVGAARADTTSSYTGTLQSPDNNAGTFDSTDSFQQPLTLGSTSDVTLQTYGFGGGMNAANMPISPGGTDPFVGLFRVTVSGTEFLNGTALDLMNYTAGCPPANTVSNFGDTNCGDVTLSFIGLTPGAYLVLLSDGQYMPCAAVSAGCNTLEDGAVDLTGGVFCNVADVDTGDSCPNVSGAWALDVTVSASTAAATPEPKSLLLLGAGLLGVAGICKRRVRGHPVP